MTVKSNLRSYLARKFSPRARLALALSPFLPECLCVDVGASYFPHVKWRLFLESQNTRWIAVEPNEANLGYLQSWNRPSKVVAVRTGLSREGGTQTLHVTNVDSGSSLLEPEIPPGMVNRVRNLEYFFPVRKVRIETRTLADVIDSQESVAPVLVKLDTQGSELSILQGAQRLIDARRIVGIESEFTMLAQPIMKGSGKFWQACEALEASGFELLHVTPIHGQSRYPRGLAFLNECDAVFALRPDLAATLPVEYRVALLAFYLSYGLLEESMAVVHDDREAAAFLSARGCSINSLIAAISRLGGRP